MPRIPYKTKPDQARQTGRPLIFTPPISLGQQVANDGFKQVATALSDLDASFVQNDLLDAKVAINNFETEGRNKLTELVNSATPDSPSLVDQLSDYTSKQSDTIFKGTMPPNQTAVDNALMVSTSKIAEAAAKADAQLRIRFGQEKLQTLLTTNIANAGADPANVLIEAEDFRQAVANSHLPESTKAGIIRKGLLDINKTAYDKYLQNTLLGEATGVDPTDGSYDALFNEQLPVFVRNSIKRSVRARYGAMLNAKQTQAAKEVVGGWIDAADGDVEAVRGLVDSVSEPDLQATFIREYLRRQGVAKREAKAAEARQTAEEKRQAQAEEKEAKRVRVQRIFSTYLTGSNGSIRAVSGLIESEHEGSERDALRSELYNHIRVKRAIRTDETPPPRGQRCS